MLGAARRESLEELRDLALLGGADNDDAGLSGGVSERLQPRRSSAADVSIDFAAGLARSAAAEEAKRELAAQYSYVVRLAVLELAPLRALETHWRRRRRRRFSLIARLSAWAANRAGDWAAAWLGSDAYAVVDADEELRCIRRVLRNGRRFIGRCELRLRDVGLGDARGLEDAGLFLDEVLMAEGGLQRTEELLRQSPGASEFVAGSGLLPTLRARIPWWERRPTAARALVYAGCGAAAFVLTRAVFTSSASGMADRAAALREQTHTRAATFVSWMRQHVLAPLAAILDSMFLTSAQESHRRALENAAQVTRQSVQDMLRAHAISSAGKTLAEADRVAADLDVSLVAAEMSKCSSAPLRATVVGNLPQLALIQSEHVLAEGFDAMLKVDKLLQENSFNTQLVILAPALLVLGGLWRAAQTAYYAVVDDSSSRARHSAQLRRHALEATSALGALQRLPVGPDDRGKDGHVTLHAANDADAAELEGRVTEAVYALRAAVGNGDVPVEPLRALLGRSGLPSAARSELCGQILVSLL